MGVPVQGGMTGPLSSRAISPIITLTVHDASYHMCCKNKSFETIGVTAVGLLLLFSAFFQFLLQSLGTRPKSQA